MQHPGLYSWPKQFRYLGIIIALIAAFFWVKQISSQAALYDDVEAFPETTNRFIEREILILDIAHDSNGFLQWYLSWDEREDTLKFYSKLLDNLPYHTEQTEELRYNIEQRLAGNWPENPDSSFLISVIIAESFFTICFFSAFFLVISIYKNRHQPIANPPLPWFSVGWILMTFLLADLFSDYLFNEIYQILYARGVYSIFAYILIDGIHRAMVPLLICCLSFTKWKHFRQKFFPSFNVHWKLLFFASGTTYIISYGLSYIFPPSDNFVIGDPVDPDLGYLIFIFLSSVIFAPIFEEITFRGILFQGTRHKLGFLPAAILSSILFASIHVQYDWVTMIYVGLGGFAGCWVTAKTGSLTTGIVMHALHNLTCFVSYYLYYQQPL